MFGTAACRAEDDGNSGDARGGVHPEGEGAVDAAARGSDGRLSAVGFAGKLRFDLQLEPGAPAVGQVFRVLVDVRELRTGKPIEGNYYSLDATMPDHAHGMSTRPSHRWIHEGRFSSEGLKFHMPGLWHFEARVEGRTVAGEAIADRVLFPFEQPLVSDYSGDHLRGAPRKQR